LRLGREAKAEVKVEGECNDEGVQAEGYEHRLKDFSLKVEVKS
jgi:hypothetical protein